MQFNRTVLHPNLVILIGCKGIYAKILYYFTKESELSNLCQVQPEGFLFNSYYTEM